MSDRNTNMPDSLRRGKMKLLSIKDSDVRLLTLEQCRTAIDHGLHAGGAFSAVIPLVTLYHGGFIDADIADPTRPGQDLFTLSKGHAVAALASIYAELGYFDQSHLCNSRSYKSILNGHPGPALPGIHIATGPMGQGLGVAQGFAIAGRRSPRFDSYCLVGDGELQEGPIWESVMFAGAKHLDNFCVLVDRNNGQLDITSRNVFPMPDLVPVFASFGWQAYDVDATSYDGIFHALERFRSEARNGKPTAIVCNTTKGFGAFSAELNRHKATVDGRLLNQEVALQTERRHARVEEFNDFYDRLNDDAVTQALRESASRMHLTTDVDAAGRMELKQVIGPRLTRRVPPRQKRIFYDASLLPKIDTKKEYAASEIVTEAMKIFARDSRVVSVDSDLGTTSGLEAGVGAVDQTRALNVGVAEANMMLLGEAFAALGSNAWISTFCPFFDWKVLRRVAVGYQERLEAMEAKDGWLSEGHGLDLTMLATAANFETRTNGATHMGNDDNLVFDAIGQLKIIDVSCPRQMLSIMKWIMEGNRGLVYVRVMRTGSPVLYESDYEFEFGKGSILSQGSADVATIVSSGRGVHEALTASRRLADSGIGVTVVDMPTIDEHLLLELHDRGGLLCFAEQNNGYILQNFHRVLYRHRRSAATAHVHGINTLDGEGRPRFIHSGTYEELLQTFGLAPDAITETIKEKLNG
jgi:transketolase